MRFFVLLFVALLAIAPGRAAACSYPYRLLPGLTAVPAEDVSEGLLQVRISVREVRIERGESRQNHWFGLRGAVVVGAGPITTGQLITITNQYSTACFYPFGSYEISPDGELLVWVIGLVETRAGVAKFVPVNQRSSHLKPRSELRWKKIHWTVPQ